MTDAIELVVGGQVIRYEQKATAPHTRISPERRERLVGAAEALQDRWSAAAALTAQRILERQKRVVLEKLQGNKARRGTRYFIPTKGGEPIVTKQLSVDDVWDTARWDQEFTDEFLILGASLYREVALENISELGALYGDEVVGEQLGLEPPPEPTPTGETPSAPPPVPPPPPEGVGAGLVAAALLLLAAGDGQRQLGPGLIAALAGDVARRATLAALANRTTRQTVDDSIRSVVWPGGEPLPGRHRPEPAEELAEVVGAVRQNFDEALGRRAKAIGDWYAPGAINEAANTTALVLGLPTRKYWLSMRDHLVRDSHNRADGQVRDWQEAFDVGGFPMQFPGDPIAPIGETINCRCVLIRVPPRGWRRPNRQRQDGRQAQTPEEQVDETRWWGEHDGYRRVERRPKKKAEEKHGDPTRPGYRLLYHGTTAAKLEGIEQEGLRPPPGVNPHKWPMLTDSAAQAARYAPSVPDAVVVEYAVPDDEVWESGAGEVHVAAPQPHNVYGFEAQAYGVLKPLPKGWIRSVRRVVNPEEKHGEPGDPGYQLLHPRGKRTRGVGSVAQRSAQFAHEGGRVTQMPSAEADRYLAELDALEKEFPELKGSGTQYTRLALEQAISSDGASWGRLLIAEGEGVGLAGALWLVMPVDEAEVDTDDPMTPTAWVEWVGAVGTIPGTGSALVQQAANLAAEVDLPLLGEPVDDAFDFWESVGWSEDPLNESAYGWGWTVDDTRKAGG